MRINEPASQRSLSLMERARAARPRPAPQSCVPKHLLGMALGSPLANRADVHRATTAGPLFYL